LDDVDNHLLVSVDDRETEADEMSRPAQNTAGKWEIFANGIERSFLDRRHRDLLGMHLILRKPPSVRDWEVNPLQQHSMEEMNAERLTDVELMEAVVRREEKRKVEEKSKTKSSKTEDKKDH
jgi:hypothetical protein